MTATGFVSAGLFFMISQAKPMQLISPLKPPSSVFCYQVMCSISCQFLIHLASLLITLTLCESSASEDESLHALPDGTFQPNTVNSAVFLLSAVMQVNNFVVNYRGHPFTQSIFENATLWRSIQVIYVVLLVVAGGQVAPLNDFLQMSAFPSPNFQAILVAILMANFGLCYGIEYFCVRYL